PAHCRPGHDRLVAEKIELSPLKSHDRKRKQTKRVIEKPVNGDPAKPLSEPRRSRDIDEKHKALFFDRRMVPPGDEVQECARTDDVSDPINEIRQKQKSNGI